MLVENRQVLGRTRDVNKLVSSNFSLVLPMTSLRLGQLQRILLELEIIIITILLHCIFSSFVISRAGND